MRIEIMTFIIYIYIFLFLASLLGQKGSWYEAQHFCNISSEEYKDVVHDVYANFGDTCINQSLPVWTDTIVAVSDWTDFIGCLDVQINKGNTSYMVSRIKQLFQGSASTIITPDVFECSLYCTGKAKYFIYYESVCTCVNEIKYGKKFQLSCVTSCKGNQTNDDQYSVYCSSGYGLPVFDFIQGLEQKIDRTYNNNYQYQCLIRDNKLSRVEVVNCLSKQPFWCIEEEASVNNTVYTVGTWKGAVDWCAHVKRPLYQKSHHRNFTSWLSPFRMLKGFKSGRETTGKGNNIQLSKCVAMVNYRPDVDQLYYQYRECSDALPSVCTVQDLHCYGNTDQSTQFTEAAVSGVSDNVTSGTMDTSTTTESKRLIVFINAALLVLCICLAVVIFIRKCKHNKDKRSLVKRNVKNVHATSFHNQHENRIVKKTYDKTNRNQNEAFPPNQRENRMIRSHDSHMNTNKETPPNQLDNTKLRGSYAEPWELRHNIVHMAEIYHSTEDKPVVPMSDDTDV